MQQQTRAPGTGPDELAADTGLFLTCSAGTFVRCTMKALVPDLFTPCIVYITTGSQAEAELIARTLVTERLAACCSVHSGVESWYRWQGTVQRDEECLLMCKTSRERFALLRDRVMEMHSYDVPEIIMAPVIEGSESYLRWMEESLHPARAVE